MEKNTIIKIVIYQNKSLVRVIGECDLIDPDNQEKIIYLDEMCLMRNPEKIWTESEKEKLIKNMARHLKFERTGFKAKNQDEVNKYLKSKIFSDDWKIIIEKEIKADEVSF